MRVRMERLLVLPFSLGCVTQSSVAVGTSQLKEPKLDANSDPPRRQEGMKHLPVVKMKNSRGFLRVANGIQKMIRRISQFLVYKEDTKEMEIGFPTDVKHVAHIGWDGSTTTNPVKGWESVHKPEVLFPSISLKQFEEAMAEQVYGPLSVSSSRFT